MQTSMAGSVDLAAGSVAAAGVHSDVGRASGVVGVLASVGEGVEVEGSEVAGAVVVALAVVEGSEVAGVAVVALAVV